MAATRLNSWGSSQPIRWNRFLCTRSQLPSAASACFSAATRQRTQPCVRHSVLYVKKHQSWCSFHPGQGACTHAGRHSGTGQEAGGSQAAMTRTRAEMISCMRKCAWVPGWSPPSHRHRASSWAHSCPGTQHSLSNVSERMDRAAMQCWRF